LRPDERRLRASAGLSRSAQGRPDQGRRHADADISGALPHRLRRPGRHRPAFDVAEAALRERAATFGIALLALAGSFTTGELGWYVRRMAEAGLAALAATNGPALMTPPGAAAPVYCTNPIAFAVPGRRGAAVLIDQAASATAYVRLRRAAEAGEPIPAGWAVGPDGAPTTDAREALSGSLLTFGGSRGANLALLVELLAAGLTGAHWSLDATSFATGDASPGAGLLLIAIAPRLLDPRSAERLEAQAERMASHGVYIPGRLQAQREEAALRHGLLLPRDLVAALRETVASG
jgi:(2R)-3-sulfolactate dehydrogenase (NADP+)